MPPRPRSDSPLLPCRLCRGKVLWPVTQLLHRNRGGLRRRRRSVRDARREYDKKANRVNFPDELDWETMPDADKAKCIEAAEDARKFAEGHPSRQGRTMHMQVHRRCLAERLATGAVVREHQTLHRRL